MTTNKESAQDSKFMTNISHLLKALSKNSSRYFRSAKISEAYFCFLAVVLVKIRSLNSLIFTLLPVEVRNDSS